MYTVRELMWLFLAYGFWGWLLETVFAAIHQKHFVNRGLVNGPFCTIYAIGGTVISILCRDLSGIWLFVGGMILATVIEWIAGHGVEHFYHERWWDYSGYRWNLDGYICLPASLLWGALGYVALSWGNGLELWLLSLLPVFLSRILLWFLAGVLLLDEIATFIVLRGRSKRLARWEQVDARLGEISGAIESWIYRSVDRRIRRAYPKAHRQKKQTAQENVFAAGCGFHKIVWLFVIGAFLGDMVETIFCRVTAGVWMSRSSVVWGPFSLVWGIGIAGVTLMLYRYRERSDRFLFLMGTALGGAYEYSCSVVTELLFGKVFWDYSHIPFNLGGRINLLYCFFWGIAAVVWFKLCYPFLAVRIERIPIPIGKMLTWVMLAFMCVNITISTMALARSQERTLGIAAESSWQEWMDTHYSDERLMQIYPNAIEVGEGK